MGKVILARHGESRRNADRKIGGQSDSLLTSVGVKNAIDLSRKVAPLGIKRIYSSRLRRALRTAQICSKSTGAPVQIVDDLAERNYGELEGCSYDDLQQRATKCVVIRGKIYVIEGPGVESLEALHTRAFHVWSEIYAQVCMEDETSLIVSHAGMIRMIRLIHHKIPLDMYFNIDYVENCGTITIE
jgi:broad specificity phosphatase PhoE